ncbi:MAG: DUF3150 domain-containing protein [Caulobacteraceae bacterium]|nr:DUF3150 domain-containing protein [Caulobacteraceae bacterium]
MNTQVFEPQSEHISIASSAMLIELSVKAWGASKTDRKVSEEVDIAKKTQARAGKYEKDLMAGTRLLHEITKCAARIRNWNVQVTLPWNDQGLRLLPSSKFFDYMAQLDKHRTEYEGMVDDFLSRYDEMVSAAAMNLGEMFDRNEYPSAEEVKRKFAFDFAISPVPVSGDFRVDIGTKANEELVKQFQEAFDSRISEAMSECWQRLHKCLTHLSDRLQVSDTGTKTVFRDSLMSNAQELCDLLKHMNLTGDPKLEAARRELSDAIFGLDSQDMRHDADMRTEVKSKVDEILSKFQF